jgi:hypothetical protein
MNRIKSASSTIIVFVFVFIFSTVGSSMAQASLGGLDRAVITDFNQVTITYVHSLATYDAAAYSNLGLGLMGRSITGVVATTSNSITISFDGPPVPPNTVGTIDIDNTVMWADAEGGFGGTTEFPVYDGIQPHLGAITLDDLDESGGLTPGDTLSFRFNEQMADNITTENIDSYLVLSNGHTFGTALNGLALSWNKSSTTLTVTIPTDTNIADGDVVNPSSFVTDISGNLNNQPAPIPMPFLATVPRTLYFNAAADGDWYNVNNWWDDAGHTAQASSTPGPYDNAVLEEEPDSITNPIFEIYVGSLILSPVGSGYIPFYSNINVANGITVGGTWALMGSVIGNATFSDMSVAGAPFGGPSFYFSVSNLIGDVTFNAPTTANYGTIVGDVTFHGEYGNAGLIFGNVEFNDFTSNPGYIIGHVTFRDNTVNGSFGIGRIVGNVDVYSPAQNPLSGTVDGTITYHDYTFDGGDGTPGNPYLISSCLQLQSMKDDLSASYKLADDVNCSDSNHWNPNSDEWVDGVIGGDLIPDSYASTTHTDIIVENNGYSGFEPVGNDSTPFTGTFDGDGHTISNLWIFRKATSYVGLFGKTSSATIEDFNLETSDIVGSSFTGGAVGMMDGGSATSIGLTNNIVRAYLSTYGGGFAGYLVSGTLDEITNSGGNVHGSGNVIGGVIGYMESGTVSNSWSSADVDGGLNIGGFVGQMNAGVISDSHASGFVTSNRSEYVIMKTGYYAGGFGGYLSGGTIVNSYATGDVNSSGNYAGGFAGYTYGLTISDSHSSGNVTATEEIINDTTYTPFYVGGFVGDAFQSNFTNTYAIGNVISPGDYVGGFAGASQCVSNFTNSYASGNVSGRGYVGGFTGDDGCEGPGSTFTKTAASGNVTATEDYVGGFAGHLSYSAVHDAYESGTVNGRAYVGGFAGLINNGGEIVHTYVRGAVTGTDSETNGGYVGSTDESVTVLSPFWNTETVGQPTGGSFGEKTTADMTTSGIYTDAGWNFDTIWRQTSEANDGYPFFLFTLTPNISAVAPADSATGVSITTAITINFSIPMDTESVGISTSPCGDVCPSYNQEWSNNNQTLTLVKEGDNFAHNTMYTISITSARSADNLPIDEAYTWSFTTESAPAVDTPAPTSSHSGGSSFERRVNNLESSGGGSALKELRKQFPELVNSGGSNTSGTSNTSSVGSSPEIKKVLKDLKVGMTNADVKILQAFLISQNKGPAALALKKYGKVTSYFGKLTRAALVEWQKANGIKPATGYFGPLTRAKIKSMGL